MKLFDILKKASLLFLLLPVFLLVTCKKDDNENSGNGYRIIKTVYSMEGVQDDSTLYEYQGDKLSLVRVYIDGYEFERMEITYPEINTMEKLVSYFHDSTWYVDYKYVYIFDGNQVIEVDFYGMSTGTLVLSGKTTISYNHGNLAELISYYYESGKWAPVDSTVYAYDGTNQYQSVLYRYFNEEWQESEKYVILYQGNQADTLHYYDYENGSFMEVSKVGFTYQGELMSEYTAYSYDNGTWKDEGSVQYTYDSHNNLASATLQDGESTDKVEYYYEQGNGNYDQIMVYYSFNSLIPILPHPSRNSPGQNIKLRGLQSDFFSNKSK
jgi:hypothetical protein